MPQNKPNRTMGDILNEILISRGVPKKKNAIRVPKVRIAGPEDVSNEQLNIINNGLRKGYLYLFLTDENPAPEKSTPLTPTQQDIISLLKDTNKSLKQYDGLNQNKVQLLTNDEYYWKLRKEYLESIKEAVRAGLIWHPLVFEFVYTYKALGDKEILRIIKRGFETGVKRPLTITDLRFINRLEEIAKYRLEGKSWPQIRLILMKGKIIKRMTWQALQKKFKKAWEEKFREVNKKPPLIP